MDKEVVFHSIYLSIYAQELSKKFEVKHRYYIFYTPLIFVWASPAQKLRQNSELFFFSFINRDDVCWYNKNV